MSIKVENLVHIYSKSTPFEKVALDNISFDISDGDFVGIIGHTGSGKSTLIQHLNGLIKPDSGKIYIDGEDITQKDINLTKVRGKVGIVFQYPEYQLFEETVYKDIAFGPTNMGYSSEEIDNIIREAIKTVGIDENLLEKSPFELSGGQKRRVAIAGVLAMNPKILILDEPTAGLDPKGREEVMEIIKSYRKAYGATVIIISHSMEDIASLCDRVLVMNKGSLVFFDTVENVFKNKEALREIGLNVPIVTRVFEELSALGVKVPSNVYTVEKAIEALKAVKEGKPYA